MLRTFPLLIAVPSLHYTRINKVLILELMSCCVFHSLSICYQAVGVVAWCLAQRHGAEGGGEGC